ERRHVAAVQFALPDHGSHAGGKQRWKVPRHARGCRRPRRSDDLTRLGGRRSYRVENLAVERHGQTIACLERARDSRGAGITQREHPTGQLDRIAGAKMRQRVRAASPIDLDDVAHKMALARRVEWQLRLTATGSPAMCVGSVSMFTANAVTT